MTNMAIKEMIDISREHFKIPVTPRGRAMQTVDWYVNGKPSRNDYDDAAIEVMHVRRK
jgi:hypothetical protein